VNTFQIDGTPIDALDTIKTVTNATFKLSCIFPCQTCLTNNTSSCLSCYSDTTITNLVNFQNSTATRPGSCVSQCGDGYYPDGNLSVCTACVSPCNTCKNKTQCTTCLTTVLQNSFDPVSGNCVVSCSSGYYSNFVDNNTGYICTVCSNGCLTCFNTATNCTSCTPPMILYNNSCGLSCPNGYYISANNSCLQCDVSCSTCSNSTNFCNICNSTYSRLYVGGPCVLSCGDKNVSSAGQCTCDISCLTCQNLTSNCTSCYTNSSNNNLYQNSTSHAGSCVNTCYDGTYSLNNMCLNCPTSCAKCSSSVNCTQCTSSYQLLNATCLNNCPAGMYGLNNVCQICSASCGNCNGSATNCTSCRSLLSLLGNTCTNDCGLMVSVATSNGLVCQSCDSTCNTCKVTPTNCTSCTGNYSLYNYQCLTNCPASTVSLNFVCVPCVEPCLTCTISTNVCLSCMSSPMYYTSRTSNSSIVTCTQNCASLNLFTNGS
jgi:hypothetical protein